jgi:hypothetical protein
MKKLMELYPKEWLKFKNEHQNYYDVLDYAVVKQLENTLLVDFSRVNYVLRGGQVKKNMVKY